MSDDQCQPGTEYRPGLKNVLAFITVGVLSGGALFYTIFIRPIRVGDPDGGGTGGRHTQITVVLTYFAMALVFVYCVYETVAMVRMIRIRRAAERELDEKRLST